MSDRYFHTSLTRISDLEEAPFRVRPIPRSDWATGDYVLAEMVSRGANRSVELTNGRMIELAEGDQIIGALGHRYATLEATGSWEEVGPDGRMEVLTGGGLLGRCTSWSMVMGPLPETRYVGHVTRSGRKVAMGDFVEAPEPERAYETPTIVVIGTSMSAGKTTAARVLIRRLKARGLRVLGAKITGAGRYRDILTMGDAGADVIHDFVDVGLPSSIVPEETYRDALRILLSKMATATADVAVVEIGASPLEPYNGDLAVEKIQHAVRMCVLCASDPYAVVGVRTAFDDIEPDLVTGIASNTKGGIDLVKKLTGLETLNVRDKESLPELDRLIGRCLDLGSHPARWGGVADGDGGVGGGA